MSKKKEVLEETVPDHLSIIINEIENPILIANNRFDIEWVNPFFTKAYGYSLEEFIRVRGASLLTASYNADISRIIEKAVKQKRVLKYESRNVTKDGRELWISSTIKPIFDEDNELSKIIVIDLNVQEKKNLEDKLALTDTIIKNIGSMVLVADSNGDIVYASPSVTTITGYPQKEILGHGWWQLSRKREWDAQKEKEFLAQCAAGRIAVSSESYEKSLVCKDGSLKWILWKDTKGPGDVVIGVGHDITDRKKQEQQLQNKNRDITDSIHYAQRIQHAIFPSTEILFGRFPDSFVYYKPKDIVSGDFYWYADVKPNNLRGNNEDKKNNGAFLMATADCTGHGVPGALMSIAGIGLLNQVVKEKGITNPSRVLGILNKKMKEFFRQSSSNSKTQDGMDIALLEITPNKKGNGWIATYAGANRPLYLYRDKKLLVYTGNKAAIGSNTESSYIFTDHQFHIEPEDTIYLFTDGYSDQFGGPKGKKFLVKRFKELLENIHSKSMAEQELIIGNTLENWMGNAEQVDDILVMGIKF